MTQPQPRSCKNCGADLLGPYCHLCGEKVITEKDRSFVHWMKEVYANFSMLDGKLIRTLKGAMIRPGRFARDYLDGLRKPYLKPLNLFLIANLIYFFIPSYNTFKTTLNNQITNPIYGQVIENTVDHTLERRDTDMSTYAESFNDKTGEVSKLIIILLAPLLGIVLYPLLKRNGLYLGDCFNLALQFWAFFTIILLIIVPSLSRLSQSLFDYTFFRNEFIGSTVGFSVSALYLFFQLSRIESSIGNRIWKVLVVIVAFMPLIFVYRFILFWVTYLLV